MIVNKTSFTAAIKEAIQFDNSNDDMRDTKVITTFVRYTVSQLQSIKEESKIKRVWNPRLYIGSWKILDRDFTYYEGTDRNKVFERIVDHGEAALEEVRRDYNVDIIKATVLDALNHENGIDFRVICITRQTIGRNAYR